MASDFLEKPASSERLHKLAADGYLDASALEGALTIAGIIPSKSSWQRFINRMLLFLGSACVLAGIIFFFAYNWADMGKFSKFGIIEAGILLVVLVAWERGLDQLSGKVSLLVAAVLPGALLAVYGQTYQTGADPYELFSGWALLILGWVLISEFPALWLIFLILLNVSLILYWGQVLEFETWAFAGLCEALFLLNGAALALWEWLSASKKIKWLTGRWIPGIMACAALTSLVIPTLLCIFDGIDDKSLLLAPILYTGSVGFCLWFYQTKVHDLFLLALCLLSLILIITSLFVEITEWEEAGVFLFFGVFVVAQSAAAVFWLRKIEKKWGKP